MRRAARLAGPDVSAEAFFQGLEESLAAEGMAGAFMGANGLVRLGRKAAGEEGAPVGDALGGDPPEQGRHRHQPVILGLNYMIVKPYNNLNN